jgi:ribose transport system permease protein
MAKGLALRLAGGQSIPDLPEAFFLIGGGKTFGVPNPIWLMAVLYLIAHVVMSRTVFGRYVYAIGGNEEAARLSGVPVKRILLVVYTICGALAGLGGVVLASQLEAGDPKLGMMYELDVIAAVVVGGTSLMGGSGKILGTLIGAFIISVIKNGMNLMGVEAFNQMIVLGAVLLAAVLLDQLKRQK